MVDSLPENDDACNELLEALVDWLPKRYPTLFERLSSSEEGIWNKVTGKKFTGLKNKRGTGALLVISQCAKNIVTAYTKYNTCCDIQIGSR